MSSQLNVNTDKSLLHRIFNKCHRSKQQQKQQQQLLGFYNIFDDKKVTKSVKYNSKKLKVKISEFVSLFNICISFCKSFLGKLAGKTQNVANKQYGLITIFLIFAVHE